MECDLLGAQLEVFDGTSESGRLLWRCEQCSMMPFPLISFSGSVFVRFRSQDSSRLGLGFRASYWTMTVTPSSPYYDAMRNQSSQFILELPNQYRFGQMGAASSSFTHPSDDTNHTRSAFVLETSASRRSMTYSPSLISAPSGRLGVLRRDGRPPASSLYSPYVAATPAENSPRYSCGMATGDSFFRSSAVRWASTQRSQAYLLHSMSESAFIPVTGSSSSPPSPPSALQFLQSVSNCLYEVRTNGTVRAVNIHVTMFTGSHGGSLYVYGGVDGDSGLLLTAELADLKDVWVQAPCGAATVVLQPYNGSRLSVQGTSRATDPNWGAYSLNIEYEEVPNDQGDICKQYSVLILALYAISFKIV